MSGCGYEGGINPPYGCIELRDDEEKPEGDVDGDGEAFRARRGRPRTGRVDGECSGGGARLDTRAARLGRAEKTLRSCGIMGSLSDL